MKEPRRIIRVDVYTDDEKTPIAPNKASIRHVTKFFDDGDEETWKEHSENGFQLDDDSDETSRNYYEGDETPVEPVDEAEELNLNRNPDGVFAS